MRKVVAYEFVSLDGVAEQPDEFVAEFDDVMEENMVRVIGTQDAVLLGRRTYDDWAAFWPTSDVEPFARFINNVDKFVVTSSALDRSWANTTAIGGNVVEEVTALKGLPGGDIGLHGSIALTQSLLDADLVDELRLVVAPVVQRRGRRLFDVAVSKRLSLTRHLASPSGHLLLDYRVES